MMEYLYIDLYFLYICSKFIKFSSEDHKFTMSFSDTVTTVFGHDVLLLHHLDVLGVVSQSQQCSGIVVSIVDD